MIVLFSPIGKWLDKINLSIDKKDRFKEIQKLYKRYLGQVGLIFIALSFIFFSGLWIWYAGTHPKPAEFYLIEKNPNYQAQNTTNTNSQPQFTLKAVQTQRTPQMSTLRVQQWLSLALIELYSMNFRNYKTTLENMRWIFREDTYESFMLEMNKKNGIIPEMLDKSMILSLTPVSEVRLVDIGAAGNRRLWKMEMDAMLVYSGALEGGAEINYVSFYVLVEEVPTTRNPYGLVISQFKLVRAR